MTQTKLLVIANDNHMSTTQQTEFTTRVQAIADKVGAELLLLDPGQRADLFDVCVTPGKATAGEIKEWLRTCSASREAYWDHAVGSAPLCAQAEALTAIQGEAISFCLVPPESAIESTVRMINDSVAGYPSTSTAVGVMLIGHLELLLAEQLKRVISDGVQINEGA